MCCREYCCEDIAVKLKSWGVEDNDTEKIIEQILKKRTSSMSNGMPMRLPKISSGIINGGKVKIAAHLRAKIYPQA